MNSPVSLRAEFPGRRENAGNFADSAAFCENPSRKHLRIPSFASKFPTRSSRELVRASRETPQVLETMTTRPLLGTRRRAISWMAGLLRYARNDGERPSKWQSSEQVAFTNSRH